VLQINEMQPEWFKMDEKHESMPKDVKVKYKYVNENTQTYIKSFIDTPWMQWICIAV
jgi:hypothetical protein